MLLFRRKRQRRREREGGGGGEGGGEGALPTVDIVKGWWQQQYDKTLDT